MKRLLMIILMLGLVIMPVYSDVFIQKKISDVQICLNNETLQKNQTWMYNDGSLTSFSTNENCANGCNEILNVCQDTPFVTYTLIFAILIVLALLIFRFI